MAIRDIILDTGTHIYNHLFRTMIMERLEHDFGHDYLNNKTEIDNLYIPSVQLVDTNCNTKTKSGKQFKSRTKKDKSVKVIDNDIKPQQLAPYVLSSSNKQDMLEFISYMPFITDDPNDYIRKNYLVTRNVTISDKNVLIDSNKNIYDPNTLKTIGKISDGKVIWKSD